MDDKKLVTLVKRAAKGNLDAFEEVYFEHAQSVLFHVRSLIVDKENYQDVAQDVALTLWKSIGQLREPAAFRGWMHQVVRSTCASHNRKVLAESSKQVGGNAEELIDTLPLEAQGDEGDPALIALKSDEKHQLFVAIQTLPPAYKEAITMRYYDELSYKEIAAVLGISTSAVGTNIMRGTEHLKKELSKESIINTALDNPEHAQMHADEYGQQLDMTKRRGQNMQEKQEHIIEVQADEAVQQGAAVAGAFVVNDSNIQSSLTTGINEIIPPSAVELYLHDLHVNLLSAGMAVATGGATAVVASKVGGKIVAGIVSAVLATSAVGVGVYSYVESTTTTNSTEWSVPESSVEEEFYYEGNPRILFTSQHRQNSPYAVTAIQIQDEVVAPQSIEWVINDSSGAEVLSGEGAYITADQLLSNLTPGEYKVVFTLTDEKGATAISSRTFTIEDAEPAE